ncbi:hypothetical protein ACFQY7_37790 [Actinomadura luteofluorescens]|uniref:hypothetical protein n=1 Tax=Actinomadura luteofluorescens TaxID=46163 RepID=UPI00362E3E62
MHARLAQRTLRHRPARDPPHPLSDYQLLNGCLEEIVAADEGELWLLCDAQTRLAERVATAERLRASHHA